MLPPRTTAFLASNLDYTGPAIRAKVALEGKRVLFITTATLAEGRPVDPESVHVYTAQGATVTLLNLATIHPETAAALVERTDAVHLAGGNTYALLASIQRTDFARLLTTRGAEHDLTVIGESAGAVVLGADIAHVGALDDPSVAPGISTTGLGWCPDLLVPHYKGEAYGLGAKIDAWLESEPDPSRYTFLHDNQALVLAPGTRRLLAA